ncbi:Crp/Fnr family transcriptional regulator [Hymenobacter cellulosilyticus]|uniref:Crp/Fnr family transcriptional regulator n=1 Tax=Hymenobacter cellulosilyticus TaxID=2932248 RepID=A0A8T9Q5M7_9BACT|nr:Crp/Fnr family transcriptional regulator [Hymenobacter cellulosilyticus]UOQ70393.1 Crp/Fnr family transcriptional regulator [Hymenobacter cellulosilyticus]
MTAAQAADIAAGFSFRLLDRHEYLLRAGTVSNEYFFLDSGIVRAFAYNADGQEVTTGLYSAGQVALEVSSFFNRTPSPEYLQALTDCRGWFITYAQLNGLFHARPEFREFGRSLLVRELMRLKTRLLGLALDPAAVRYEALRQASPEILQQVPLKYLASYLGITDSSLSRLRAAAAKGPEAG